MIKKTLIEISNNFTLLSENCEVEINNASKLMIKSLKKNKKIIYCGNGGSAADSQHLSAELLGRYKRNRRPLPAITLTTNSSTITAIANDFSYEDIFSRQLEALGDSGDIFYAISTSGKSSNIIKALHVANQMNIKVIGLTGADGGDMLKFCDVLIQVPAKSADRIQEMHIAVGHIICETIENALC
tara:strand:+ start:1440 stop:1997 length:558 start_codon:yes stop_codon:yes gene_type:complete